MMFSKARRPLLAIVTIMLASFAFASEIEAKSMREQGGSPVDLDLQAEGDTRDLSEPISVAPAGTFELGVRHDSAPRQTSWVLKKGSTVIARQRPNEVTVANELVRRTFILGNGTYTFRISDSNGDGLCCDNGYGSWSIWTGDDLLYESNGMFSTNETKTFMLF
jgi:lysyl endopeptidase